MSEVIMQPAQRHHFRCRSVASRPFRAPAIPLLDNPFRSAQSRDCPTVRFSRQKEKRKCTALRAAAPSVYMNTPHETKALADTRAGRSSISHGIGIPQVNQRTRALAANGRTAHLDHLRHHNPQRLRLRRSDRTFGSRLHPRPEDLYSVDKPAARLERPWRIGEAAVRRRCPPQRRCLCLAFGLRR